MISLTTEAQEKLASIVGTDNGTESAVRVSVIRGPHGCVHGWNLGIEDEQNPDDTVLEFDGLRLLVEPDLTEALEGAKIDYTENSSAIGFTIDAPNSQGHGGNEHGGCGNH
ncbi:MAG: iron-sulfur cluster assembly accessory protein [Acidimicrobiia bacterium]|nr:MAG: iron-sulfur cluster assembly accessory protein [Acidimicrobiia bacterium]